MELFELAGEVFPYSWYIRTRAAYAFVASGEITPVSVAVIRKALLTDPYSIDLLAGLYRRDVAYGETIEAGIVKARLDRLLRR